MFTSSSKKTFTFVSTIFLAVYLIGILFGEAIRSVFPSLDTDSPSLLEFSMFVIIAQVGINFLPSLGITIYKKQSIKETYKLNGVNRQQLGLAVLLFIIVNGMLSFIHYVTQLISNVFGTSYQMSTYPIADNWGDLMLLVICIGLIPPICEDLFFRGFLLSNSSQHGAHVAVVFTAFVFAIFHDNVYRFGEIFVYALFVGYIVYYTNSILPGLIIHVLTNTSYVIGSFILSGDFVTTNNVMANDTFEWSTFLMLAALACISFYLCIKIIKKLKTITPASVREFEENNKTSFSLKPFLNIPILLIIVIFIVRITL
jgi:uncharacterized protein